MIRVILFWLGWAFIAFGLLEIAYEIYVMLSVTADTANSTEQARPKRGSISKRPDQNSLAMV